MRKGNWSITGCSRVCREVFQDCGNRTLQFPRSLLNRRNLVHSRRVNGLQLPLHPQQVVGWLALVGISVGTFTVILPLLVENIKRILSSILGVTLSIHIIAHLIALLLDPGEKEIRINDSLKFLPEFDRDKHNHVIENGRCHLCNIDATSSRTKHCSICNKCIENFDHHCKWLNNCIGGRNYKAFIICVITAVLFVTIVTFITIIEITLINKNIDGNSFNLNDNNNKDKDKDKDRGEKKLIQSIKNMDNGTTIPSLIITQSSSSNVPGTGSIIIIYLVGILSAIAAALLIHLCFFHGYIACLGITTYEYVRRKRDKKMAKNRVIDRDNFNDRNNRVDDKRFNNNNSNFNFCTKYFNNDDYDDDDDVDVGRKLRYQFRKSISSSSSSTAAAKGNSEYSNESNERNVYICSTEKRESSSASLPSSSGGIKGLKKDNRRNFHLYFSYETRDSETSIEVSSSNERILNNKIGIMKNDDENSIEKYRLKPSTPSPVSCCFSITNNNGNNKSNIINMNKNINDINKSSSSSSTSTSTTNDGNKRCNRSCMTMKRIQSFLRTRLRRGSYNQRKKRTSNNGDEIIMAVARPTKRNKINPTTLTEENNVNDNGNSNISLSDKLFNREDESSRSSQSARPSALPPPPPLPPPPAPPHPLKLPPLIIPSRDNKIKQTTMIEAISDSQNHSAATIAINQSKRSIQQPLRIRRTSFYKRPRFKMGSHVTETAQLSPIPESEFSKPASPRTPPQINHFPFPSFNSSCSPASSTTTTTLPPDYLIEHSSNYPN